MTSPTDENTIDVTLTQLQSDLPSLGMTIDGQTVSEIEFTPDKTFIRFTFPDGYSNFDVRIFELDEFAFKRGIMELYAYDPALGIRAFEEQWQGQASSGGRQREFVRKTKLETTQTLVLKDKDLDCPSEGGTLHFCILSFYLQELRFLQDPRIRNMSSN